MNGVFITGTDTEIGKTTVAAGILKMLYGGPKVAYWKPIQTGSVLGDDTKEVQELTHIDESAFFHPTYSFPDPVTPFLAARNFHQEIDTHRVWTDFEKYRESHFLVIEGAGGLLVPLTENVLLADLVRRFEFPVIVVAPNRLGTINQTLLTLKCCKEYGIKVLGVILTRSVHGRLGNAECIENFGSVPVLAELRDHPDRRDTITDISTDPGIRKLFGVARLPC